MKYKPRPATIAVEHPDGGVFHLKPLSVPELLEYTEWTNTKELAFRDGQVVCRKDGSAVTVEKRISVREFIDWVLSRIGEYEHVEDENGVPVDAAGLRAIVSEYVSDTPMVGCACDGCTEGKALGHPKGRSAALLGWLAEAIIEISRSKAEAEAKN